MTTIMPRNVLPLLLFVFGWCACGTSHKAARSYPGQAVEIRIASSYNDGSRLPTGDVTLRKMDVVQGKYARLLSVPASVLTQLQLYYFIDKWLYTPYKWGGTDTRGIDCSAFIQRLLAEVYMIQVPRTSVQQFFTNRIEPFASTRHLSEGDLVFFRTMDNTVISHVGMYLHNNMFVSASSSRGVSIASLNDPYWKKKFVAAGRMRTH